MNVYPQDDTVTHNQSQLDTLSRTLQLSEGEFSLVLVRCNYISLRKTIVKQLHKKSALPIREIHLSASIDNLYRTLETELSEEHPAVVMVFGLERVETLDEVLAATNLAREAFLNFPFPVLLWINDQLWKKLNRRAPDFTGYATTYVFQQSSSELIHFLSSKSQQLFTTILELGGCSFVSNSKILGEHSASELQLAYQDLTNRKITLTPALTASLRFVLARHYYAHQNISEALENYNLSWNFWQQESTKLSSRSSAFEAEYPLVHSSPAVNPLIWQGIILYHLGLCSAYQAEQHLRHSSHKEWLEARMYFEQCLDYFERAKRPDLVAKFINQLGEILRELEDWDALFKLALKSRKLHQQQNSQPLQLAQDYGFLAEYYRHKSDWQNTKEFASIALEILNQNPQKIIDDPLTNKNQGLYYWILAQALEQLSQPWEAIEKLEIAYKETAPKYNPRFYLQILGMLRRLYFELGQYREAFDIKKEHRTKSSAFGYTAFIGAGRLEPREQAVDPMLGTVSTEATVTDEIKASGREEAINRLLQRIGSTQHKLTVIYGQSGVGKSSIIRAGLVPALQDLSVEARQIVPILLRTYNSYAKELEKKLYADRTQAFLEEEETIDNREEAEKSTRKTEQTHQEAIKNILLKLKENANNNQITILIFDQFEEFFFAHRRLSTRRLFFELLRDCLNLPYVKVMISVRDDYLHHLLEGTRLIDFEIVNNDILNKDILFYLGNLTPTEAYNVIKSLTDRSHFFLEDALIQALVNDLSRELGEVRPIELQVVGAQLQAEDITTLADYKRQGPHQKLVERFLEEVIQDCGPEHQQTANLILFLLTDENNTRPLKTRSELTEELKGKLGKEAVEYELDLILYILAKSGLVSREIIDGAEFYQLVHDYLADFIRHKNRLDRDAEFEQLQQKNKALKEDVDVYSRLAKETERRSKAEERSRQLERIMAALAGFVFAGLGLFAMAQRKQEARARIEAIQAAQESLIVGDQNDQIGILRATLVIGESIQQTQASKEQKDEIAKGLRKLFDNSLHERNRLEQEDSILAASYSPDGQIIATAGNEKVIKLWGKDGRFIQDLIDPSLNSQPVSHEDNVISVSFSPDGNQIASASVDRTVKLWSRDGQLLKTFKGHQDVVTSVSFSPDGRVLASGSGDSTIKLWDVEQETLIKTLNAHQGGVLDVKFSPDGQTLASGGNSDPTVKLWKPDGTFLKTLRGHCESLRQTEDCIGVYEVSFSPNGQILASASGDRTVRLWNLKTNTVETLKGHNSDVLGVSFSPDGQTIASSSRDSTVKLWSKNGAILQTFTGHKNDVWTVSFSPDSQMIASASADNTVKLWDRNRNPLDQILQGHSHAVNDISWSLNGMIATASDDQTVRLWKTDSAEPLKNSTDEPLVLNNQKQVRWVSLSPDGETLATVSQQQPTVKLWNLKGELVQTLSGHQKPVNAVEFSPTGMIASGSEDRTVKLWQPDGSLIDTLNLDDPVVSIRFNALGNQMATATSDSTGSAIQLWSSQKAGWESRRILSYPNQTINEISYTPKEGLLAIAVDRQVILWSPSRGASCPLKHQAIVRGVDFHPNGTLIASASDDKKVRLWQLDRQQLWPVDGNCSAQREIEAFYTLDQDVFLNSVYFDPDGKLLAIAREDGTTILWNMQGFQLGYQIRAGCLWLNDYLQTDTSDEQNRTPLCQGIRNSEQSVMLP
ncbi:AAA family ATPase [Limnoraphis robusta]|uniref:AAA family ATPase n=2 Tax=Limnoraphis TaxID=1332112 RepID=A0ABU5TW09_9CYAN|nr:AAA family ATPase [Limnoraphis robusta]MEA5519097.1 AAA family ATPase [Limnoraphis robusta CCNP1315]MEA5548838.1 AAA family ATPase [Limnoraphis robusta CCNP1324]